MKIKHTVFALAAILATGSAFAQIAPARIAISSGSSSIKGNFALALQALCTANYGTMTAFNNFSKCISYC